MYIKTVNINGNDCRYVYVKVERAEVCLGYLDRFNNLVVYSRKK